MRKASEKTCCTQRGILFICLLMGLTEVLSGCGAGTSKKETPAVSQSAPDIAVSQSTPGGAEGAGRSFAGVEWTKEDEEKYAVYQGSRDICADRDRGGVYYVNWNEDNYLYYWKDGKTKLVLDKWVSQICYLDGTVYCIYDETGETYDPAVYPSYEGVMCSVDVKTGKLKQLAEVRAKELGVCSEGLYYEWTTGPGAEEQKQEYGVYSFADKAVYSLESRYECGIEQDRYGKYAITSRENTCYLKNLENGSEQAFISAGKSIGYTSVYNDFFYYSIVDGGKISEWNAINLKDGREKTLNGEIRYMGLAQLNGNPYLYQNSDYSGSIIAYDPEQDTDEMIEVKDTYSSVHSAYITDELYSDGEYLYTMIKEEVEPQGMVVLKVSDDGKEISEFWSSLEERDAKKKKSKKQ